MASDYIAEVALLDLSRLTREAEDKLTRWHLELLAAGVEEDEAAGIIADISTEPERIAA